MSKGSATPMYSNSSQSPQYQAIHNLYDDLVEAIIPEFASIITKAFSKKMVGKQQLHLFHNVGTSSHQKASFFLFAIISRLSLDSQIFDDFLALLSEIESLHYMKERLQKEVADLSASCLTDENVPSNSNSTVQLPKLDLAEDIELQPVSERELSNHDSDIEVLVVGNEDSESSVPLLQSEEHQNTVDDGKKYSSTEIFSLQRRYFTCGCCYTFILLTVAIFWVVGITGIIFGALIMSEEITCTKIQIVFDVYGLFILFVGLTLLLLATSLTLWCPYHCCRLFDKCQSRAWRTFLCVGVVFELIGCFFALGTFFYSIFIGIAFYPIAEEGSGDLFEKAGCSSLYVHIIYFYLVFTHAISIIFASVIAIGFLIACIYRLVKITIFTDPSPED